MKARSHFAIRKVGHGWQVYDRTSHWVSRHHWAYLHLAEAERDRLISGRDRGRASRDPKIDKKKLWQTIDREQRTKDRAKAAHLRAEAKRMRALKKEGGAQARALCDSGREKTKRAIADRERAKRRAREIRLETQGACKLGRAYAKGMRSEVQRAKGALEHERAHQASLRVIKRSAKGRTEAIKRGHSTARVRQGESDDEVRQNIDPSHVALFNRVKRQIRATPRLSRTEAFLHYVEEHPREADAAIEDKTEAILREMQRRQRTG